MQVFTLTRAMFLVVTKISRKDPVRIRNKNYGSSILSGSGEYCIKIFSLIMLEN
jgi:hypothetical protein